MRHIYDLRLEKLNLWRVLDGAVVWSIKEDNVDKHPLIEVRRNSKRLHFIGAWHPRAHKAKSLNFNKVYFVSNFTNIGWGARGGGS